LSLPNFIRQRCDIPLETQGKRKDLLDKAQSNKSMGVSGETSLFMVFVSFIVVCVRAAASSQPLCCF